LKLGGYIYHHGTYTSSSGVSLLVQKSCQKIIPSRMVELFQIMFTGSSGIDCVAVSSSCSFTIQ